MHDRDLEINALLAGLEHPELKKIDLSLTRMRGLLAALGNPQASLPPVIHVAGTNGKGSLIAYLQAMARQAGLRAHRYISPHLVRFHERIVLNHLPIDDAYLKMLLARVKAMTGAYPATFFEATTAVAFLAFAENPADLLLLEVGLGGRLDATNAIDAPLLTAITPVSMDHQEYLGDRLASIAREKAGIIKPSVVCVVGPQKPDALTAIEDIAMQAGAPLFRHGVEWNVTVNGRGWEFISEHERLLFPLPNLQGAHQIMNAATAIACMRQLPQLHISTQQMKAGIVSADWPGRLQRLSRGKLFASLPGTCEVWLDGGHNAAAGEALAEWAEFQKDAPLFLICGMTKHKDSEAFLRPLVPFISHAYAVGIPGESMAKSASEVADAAHSVGLSCRLSDLPSALQDIAAKAGSKARILIAGSLYLVGYMLAENY